MKDARIPGLALAIVRDGHAVHLRGFGRADASGRPFTPQTPFFIGSNSTLVMVGELHEPRSSRRIPGHRAGFSRVPSPP
jgi:hypothetical protein